jgi:hypothetical protein
VSSKPVLPPALPVELRQGFFSEPEPIFFLLPAMAVQKSPLFFRYPNLKKSFKIVSTGQYQQSVARGALSGVFFRAGAHIFFHLRLYSSLHRFFVTLFEKSYRYVSTIVKNCPFTSDWQGDGVPLWPELQDREYLHLRGLRQEAACRLL